MDVNHYSGDDQYLFKKCCDCVPEEEIQYILHHYHSLDFGSHFGGQRTAMKVLKCGIYMPNIFKDANSFVMQCDSCRRSGNVSRRYEMPLHGIMEVELLMYGV